MLVLRFTDASGGTVVETVVSIQASAMLNQKAILRRLARRWPMCEYDLLTRNCVHFADELVKNLCGSTSGVKPWMGRLARIGATVVPFVSRIFEGSAASSEGSRSITAS